MCLLAVSAAVIELFLTCHMSVSCAESKAAEHGTPAGFLMQSRGRSSVPIRWCWASNGEAFPCIFLDLGIFKFHLSVCHCPLL